MSIEVYLTLTFERVERREVPVLCRLDEQGTVLVRCAQPIPPGWKVRVEDLGRYFPGRTVTFERSGPPGAAGSDQPPQVG